MATSSTKNSVSPILEDCNSVDEEYHTGSRSTHLSSAANDRCLLGNNTHSSDISVFLAGSLVEIPAPNDPNNDGTTTSETTCPVTSKVEEYAKFNHLDFLFRGLLLYPIGLLNYFLYSKFPSVANNSYGRYFSTLPLCPIGWCLLWNAVAIAFIVYFQGKFAYEAMFYWLYVYELFFAQTMVVQVQLHMKNPEYGTFDKYFEAMFFGKHYSGYTDTFLLKWDEVLTYVSRGADINQDRCDDPREGEKGDKLRFRDHPGVYLKERLRWPVQLHTTSIIFYVILVVFLWLVLALDFSSVIAYNLETQIVPWLHIPEATTYSTESISIVPACRMNISSTEDNDMARAFVGWRLTPEPSVSRGLPCLTLRFYQGKNSSSIDHAPLNFSIDQLGSSTMVNTTASSVDIQLLDKQGFLTALVSFPDVLCLHVPRIYLAYDQVYSASTHILDPAYDDKTVTGIFAAFVLIPVMLNVSFRIYALYMGTMSTWDFWHAFDTCMTESNYNGFMTENRYFWEAMKNNSDCDPIFDNYNSLPPVDFSEVENCIAWYKLRKKITEITNVNLRFVFPLLYIALLEFIASIACVCWCAVLGRAPFPGYLYLFCLFANALPMMVVLYPLYNIWGIQYGHIGIISSKCLELEMMPPCGDPSADMCRLKAIKVLEKIKDIIVNNDKRMSVLGFELSPKFLGSLGTVSLSVISFVLGRKLEFYSHKGWKS